MRAKVAIDPIAPTVNFWWGGGGGGKQKCLPLVKNKKIFLGGFLTKQNKLIHYLYSGTINLFLYFTAISAISTNSKGQGPENQVQETEIYF